MEEEPCYVQLGMREEGDERLASVYKPEKRGKLVVRPSAPGDSILACCGRGQCCREPQQITSCLHWRGISGNAG